MWNTRQQHIYANIVCKKVLAGYVALPPRVDTCSRVYLLSKHCDVWHRFVRFAQINKKNEGITFTFEKAHLFRHRNGQCIITIEKNHLARYRVGNTKLICFVRLIIL